MPGAPDEPEAVGAPEERPDAPGRPFMPGAVTGVEMPSSGAHELFFRGSIPADLVQLDKSVVQNRNPGFSYSPNYAVDGLDFSGLRTGRPAMGATAV